LTAFTSAPAWALILATAAIVSPAVWWFRGRLFDAQVSGLKEQVGGLKEQIAAVEQRLKLASEASAASERSKEELDKQFQDYKADVAAKGSNASPAKVDAAFEQLTKVDGLISHALILAHQAVQEKEARSLPVGTGYAVTTEYPNGLEATLRELGGLGALRKVDPETLDKIKNIGKPFVGKNIGRTLNSLPEDWDKRD
jgi:hypothetical protein